MTVYFGSCVGGDVEVVHKAVGDSLDLLANYVKVNLVDWKYKEKTFAEYGKNQITLVQPSLFPERIKKNKDNFSITIEDLKHQDAGNFTIVAVKVGGSQPPTKRIVLHVHNRIKNVQIDYKISRLSKNCLFHLHCETLDDLNSSYSWNSDQGKSLGPQLNISLHPAESSKVSCTADNNVSRKSTEETLVCTEESKYTITGQITVVKIVSFLLAVCPYLLATVVLLFKIHEARVSSDVDQSQFIVTEDETSIPV